MVETKFRAYSGNISEWVVVSQHTMFSDAWKCYPLEKYVPGEPLKEGFVQYFSEDFINKNKLS